MHFTEDTKRARNISEAALEHMEKRGIPTNPNNFLVWYSYADGSHPDLSRALDVLISNNVDFTAQRNEEIYERYFAASDGDNETTNAAEKINETVGNVVKAIEQGSSDKHQFGEKMATISKNLCDGKDAGEVSEIVRSILLETQSIINKSKQLEEKLVNSSQEINTLRDHLQSVRQEAMTDGLTSLANRKAFDQRLREEAAAAMEEGTSLCLILADIDHFKKFNDTFGHRVGDSVLKVVARSLTDGVKGQDMAARYGGEEFCIILPSTSLENAAKLADQIRSKLSKKEMKNTKTNESYGVITLSLGISEYRYGEALADLIQRADDGLYRAKHLGRNQVVTEQELGQSLSVAV